VKSIEVWSAPEKKSARAGESIGITLTEQIFVERGHIGSLQEDAPIESNRFKARLFWMGKSNLAIGQRTKLKLTTNLWIMNLVENLCETFALAEANGLDPRLFLDAISGRPMDTPYATMKGEKILNRDFSPAFTVANAVKDVRLALAMASEAGIELGLGPATLERFERAIELGHGDQDTAAAWFASRRD